MRKNEIKIETFFYKMLLKNLPKPENHQQILPDDLWKIVSGYWSPTSSIRCAITRDLLTDPVFIDHPQIQPLLYNRSSILTHIASGELKGFGITVENADQYLVPVNLHLDNVLQQLEGGINNQNNNEEKKEEPTEPTFLATTPNNGQDVNPVIQSIQVPAERNAIIPFLDNPEPIISIPIRRIILAGALVTSMTGNITYITVYGIELLLDNRRRMIFSIPLTAGYFLINIAIDYQSILYLISQRNRVSGENEQDSRMCCLLVILPIIILLSKMPLLQLSIEYLFEKIGNESEPQTSSLLAMLVAGLSVPRYITGTDILFRRPVIPVRSPRTPWLVMGVLGACVLTDAALNANQYIQAVRGGSIPLFRQNILLFSIICSPLIDLPLMYVATRETAQAIIQMGTSIIWHRQSPLQAIVNTYDRDESTLTFMLRTSGRVLASILVGLIVHLASEDPVNAVFAAVSYYIMSSLITAIRSANNRYRFIPLQDHDNSAVPLLSGVAPAVNEDERVVSLDDDNYYQLNN